MMITVKIVLDNKESVMEYTDCENCARLEAENVDLEVTNQELTEQLDAFRAATETFFAETDGI